MRRLGELAVTALFASLLSCCATPWLTSVLGEARAAAPEIRPGNLLVRPRQSATPSPPTSRPIAALIGAWASQPLPDWKTEGKVTAPRVILARLTLGRDVAELNVYLGSQLPWGRVGSTWPLHPQGDYDFTEIPLCATLPLLEPDTARHVLDVLLTQEGGTPTLTVPRTLGLVMDTENHILMTEGARYLRNQELARRGSTDPAHDNERNGHEAWLYAHLVGLERAGMYEFNSNPYLGYTTMALLTLEGLADSERVRGEARLLLDTIALQYAYGSLELRRFAPFRRQLERAGRTELDGDPHTALMKAWLCLSRPERTEVVIGGNTHQALYAALMPYRVPEPTLDILEGKREPYYVRIGRGQGATPELYSGGPDYLLSAGGCGRGRRSSIVARPTVLMLRDGARDLKETFHMAGKGPFTSWNNTGVLPLTAVGEGMVEVPEGMTPVAEAGYGPGRAERWQVYEIAGGPPIAVLVSPGMGIIALFPGWRGSSAGLAGALVSANPDPEALVLGFTRPEADAPFRTTTYELDAGPGRWVIASVDGDAVERDYDAWPRMTSGL